MKNTSSLIIKIITVGLLVIFGLWAIIVKQNSVLKLLFPSKVWVHRVNSIHKLNNIGRNYRGIELDVEFDKAYNKFQVNHPPSKPIDLFLNTYLKKIDLDKKYWIDLKNLDSTNSRQISTMLTILIDSLKLNKNNFIIESPNCKELPIINSTFNVSYYLPSYLTNLESSQKKTLSDSIKINIKKYKPNYISSSIVDYYYLREEFDQHMILWALSDLKINSLNDFITGTKSLKIKLTALMDDKVEVVLVTDLGEIGER